MSQLLKVKIRLLGGRNPEVEGVHTTILGKNIIRTNDSQLRPSIKSILRLTVPNDEWEKGKQRSFPPDLDYHVMAVGLVPLWGRNI